jgi:hypothetical protein
MPEHIHATVQNIEYYHKCLQSARDCATVKCDHNPKMIEDCQTLNVDDRDTANHRDSQLVSNFGPDSLPEVVMTEEDIADTIDNPFNPHELVFADLTINVGLDTGALTQ